MSKTSGIISWSSGKATLTFSPGITGITFSIPESESDGIWINVDQLHENTELGFPLRPGQSQEFSMETNTIKTINLSAMSGSPIVDFGVTKRV